MLRHKQWLLCALAAWAAACATGPAGMQDASRDAVADSASDAGVMDSAPEASPDAAQDVAPRCEGGASMLCDGACVDTATDGLNCGACGTRCAAGMACTAGRCAIVCPASQSVCSGLCVSTASDPANCGSCGNACPSGQVCSMGMCAASCGAGLTNCGGSCVVLSTDAAHCGSCSNACALPGVNTQVCLAGVCAVGPCAAGQGDCDGMTANGCETNVRGADVNNCGGCGIRCAYANAGATCTAGVCGLGACATGFADCDGNAANGCETDTRTNNANCGACSTSGASRACASGQVCSAGACGATCGAGTVNCSGDCVRTATDVNNCGGCGTACALANVSVQACSASQCVVGACGAGFGDCDRTAANGCETNVRGADVNNCGGCGIRCAYANAGATCTAGVCGLGACATGFADCDGNAANGCEVDTRSSNGNCGACGNACGAGSVCSMGACGTTCALPLTTCGTGSSAFCTNTATDPNNCGACANGCPSRANAATACAASRCGFLCNPGFGDCNASRTDGCETNTDSSASDCGACGVACASGQSCLRGACLGAPRLLAPLSTATVTSLRPTLRWLLNGGDGAHIDLCRDRAMTAGCVGFDAVGTTGSPAANLARGAWFWRATARVGGTTTTQSSRVWELFVTGRGAGPNSTWVNDLDLNSDGFADLATVNGSGGVEVELGGASGPAATPLVVSTGATTILGLGNIGDVDGDGYPELMIQSAVIAATNVFQLWLIPGGPAGPAAAPVPFGPAVPNGASYYGYISVGDLNGDGYGDVAYSQIDTQVSLFLGSAAGLSVTPALTLPTPLPAGGRFGFSQRSADFDADGLPDLIVGAADSGAPALGRLVLFPGVAGAARFGAPVVLSTTATPQQTQMMGASLAVGDFNGDGYADFTTEPEYSNFQLPPAQVWFGSAAGISPAPGQLVVSNNTGDLRVGACGSGDFNGDGFTDVAYGAQSSLTGELFIYLGGPTGLTFAGIRVPGTVSNGRFAFYNTSVISPGDVDGDGFADLLASAFYATPSRVQYHRGNATGVTPAPARVFDYSPAFNGGGRLW